MRETQIARTARQAGQHTTTEHKKKLKNLQVKTRVSDVIRPYLTSTLSDHHTPEENAKTFRTHPRQ